MTAFENVLKILESDSNIKSKKKDPTPEQLFKRKVFQRTNGEYRVIGKFKSNYEEIEMEHIKCGQTFKIEPYKFISGTRCTLCNSSKGERKIMKYLNKAGVNYKREFTINELVSDSKTHLRFDFAIYDKHNDLTCLIEYDGMQHFKKANGPFGAHFERLKQHDAMKDNYCKENGIKLIRIPYWEYKNIEKILKDKIK